MTKKRLGNGLAGLKLEGYAALTASSGEEAVKVCASTSVDLVAARHHHAGRNEWNRDTREVAASPSGFECGNDVGATGH